MNDQRDPSREPGGDDLEVVDLEVVDLEVVGLDSTPVRAAPLRPGTRKQSERAGAPGSLGRSRRTIAMLIVAFTAVAVEVWARRDTAPRQARDRDIDLGPAPTATASPLPQSTITTGSDISDGEGPWFGSGTRGVVLTGARDGMRRIRLGTGRVERFGPVTEQPVRVVARNRDLLLTREDDRFFVTDLDEPGRIALAGTQITAETGSDRYWIGDDKGRWRSPPTGHEHRSHGGEAVVGAWRNGLLTLNGATLRSVAGTSPKRLASDVARVVGVHPDRIAYLGTDCGTLRCGLRWVDADGRVGEIPLGVPVHVQQAVGTFSPDARLLALTSGSGPVDPFLIVDLGTGRVVTTQLRGVRTTPIVASVFASDGIGFAWLDGRHVVAADPYASAGTAEVRLVETNGVVGAAPTPLHQANSIAALGVEPTEAAGTTPPPREFAALLGEPTALTLTMTGPGRGATRGVVEQLDLDSADNRALDIEPLQGPNPIRVEGATLVSTADGWVAVSDRGTVRGVGEYVTLLPADSRTIYGARWDRGRSGRMTIATIDTIDIESATVIATTRTRESEQPVGSTTRGLAMVNIDSPDARVVTLWDPVRGSRVRIRLADTGNGRVTAIGRTLAWSPSDCGSSPCRTRVRDLVSGRTTRSAPRAALVAASPSGRFVAFRVRALTESDPTLQVIDVERGVTFVVPGSGDPAAVALADLGWIVWNNEAGDLQAWRPGLAETHMIARGVPIVARIALG